MTGPIIQHAFSAAYETCEVCGRACNSEGCANVLRRRHARVMVRGDVLDALRESLARAERGA